MNRPVEERTATRLELVALLFAAGLGIGLVFPLSKLASISGISPLAYIGWSALGASVVLFLLAWLTGSSVRFKAPNVRYAMVAGALTYAIPFGTLAFVVGRLGSGIPAIFQSLTPLFTLALVSLLRMERLGGFRIAGLILGFAGVLLIILWRDPLALEEASAVWFAAALVTPLALACGNIYRSYAWPVGEKPVTLAAMTFAAAALLTLGLQGFLDFGEANRITLVREAWPVIAGQSLASGLGYFLFFRLQQAGGPIYLSQISYVNTAVGVVSAAIFFGEPIGAATILAVVLIFAGIALVNRGTPRRIASATAGD